jgi:hypothetical protein
LKRADDLHGAQWKHLQIGAEEVPGYFRSGIFYKEQQRIWVQYG